jgi:hypothetical protein
VVRDNPGRFTFLWTSHEEIRFPPARSGLREQGSEPGSMPADVEFQVLRSLVVEVTVLLFWTTSQLHYY